MRFDPETRWTLAYLITHLQPKQAPENGALQLGNDEIEEDEWYDLQIHVAGRSALAGDREETLQVAWQCEVQPEKRTANNSPFRITFQGAFFFFFI